MNDNKLHLLPALLIGLALNVVAGPTPFEPPLTQTSADTGWRFVGIKNGATCPLPQSGGGTVWTTTQLFRFAAGDALPPGLRNFCVYEAVAYDNQPDTARVTDLRCSMSAPPCLTEVSKDSLSVNYMGATAQELETVLAPGLGLHLRRQAGRFTSWDADRRVRLVFVDTEPNGIDQDLDGPGNSEHGFSLLSIGRDLLCPNSGNCGIELATGLGLPRVTCGTSPSGYCVDPDDGGYVGTISEVARAIRGQVRDWTLDGTTSSLVINLSVAWDVLFNLDEFGNQRVAAQAVFAALQDAACRGALVIAAAGNGHAGTTAASGPMYPAAWETADAPSFAQCQTLVTEPLDNADFAPAGAYRPLLHAVAAVNTFDEFVTPRTGGMPRLAAYGDHAVTQADFGGPLGPSAVMTGTSVSAAVASAAAAAVWYFRQDLAAWEIINLVHGSGDLLHHDGAPRVADFCLDTGAPDCPGVRRVQICDAVSDACDDAGVSCPVFSCPPREPVMPAFDVDEIVTRFASADSFDIPDAVNQTTVTACGPGYEFFWKTNPQPANPCPHRQFHAIQVTPWTDGQPSGVVCELCGSASRSPGVLYIELKEQFQGQVSDLTLVCGGDPSIDSGPFEAYRLETLAALTGGDRFRVDNLPTLCETAGMSLATTVIGGGGGATPASTLNAILILTDRDNDKIRDTEDNCEIAPNDQTDTDGDSIGNRCDPDIALPNDCLVNFLDFLTFRLAIFSTPADVEWNPDADYNGDGIVNFGDVEIMKGLFFGVPGPSGLADLCD